MVCGRRARQRGSNRFAFPRGGQFLQPWLSHLAQRSSAAVERLKAAKLTSAVKSRCIQERSATFSRSGRAAHDAHRVAVVDTIIAVATPGIELRPGTLTMSRGRVIALRRSSVFAKRKICASRMFHVKHFPTLRTIASLRALRRLHAAPNVMSQRDDPGIRLVSPGLTRSTCRTKPGQPRHLRSSHAVV